MNEESRKVLDEILDSVECNDESYDAGLERLTNHYFDDVEFQKYFYDRFFSWEDQSNIDRGLLEESDAIQNSFEQLLFEQDIERLGLEKLIG